MNLTGTQIAAVIFGGCVASIAVGAYQGDPQMVHDSLLALAWFTVAALLAVTITVTVRRTWEHGNDGGGDGHTPTPDPTPTGGRGLTEPVQVTETVELTAADLIDMWKTRPAAAPVPQKTREVTS